jgi:hypothetical protein
MNDYLTLLKDEYLMVREEAAQTDKNAQSILKYALIIIGVIIGFGIEKWDDKTLSGLVFLFFVPVICYLFLTMWMGEFARKLRVAHYILDVIEPKMLKALNGKPSPFEWESWLRQPEQKNGNGLFVWNRIAAIIVLLGFAVASIIIGMMQIYQLIDIEKFTLILLVELALLTIITKYNYMLGKNMR